MNKFLCIWLFIMALVPISAIKAQMITRKLHTLYYDDQDVQVYHDVDNGKYYLKNVRDPQNPNSIPKIETRFCLNYPATSGDDYLFYDKINSGNGPYIINDYVINGEEGVTAYWTTCKVLEYYHNLSIITTGLSYAGLSNIPTETLTLRIAGNGMNDGEAATSGISNISLGNTRIHFNQKHQAYTLEIAGHETTHQILAYRGLPYKGDCELGYIHESIGDAFGILAKNFYLQQNFQKSNEQTPTLFIFSIGRLKVHKIKFIMMQVALFP